jgi:hypothetical protein
VSTKAEIAFLGKVKAGMFKSNWFKENKTG